MASKYDDTAAGHEARVNDWLRNADTFPARLVPQEPESRVFEVDGWGPYTWQEMSEANEEEVMADLDVLAVGESWTFGGGAFAESTVRRIA